MDKTRHNRYFTYLRWITTDIVRSQWWFGLISGVFNFLGQLLQTASLGIALYYGGLIASDTNLALFGETYETRGDKNLLLAVAGSIMVLYGFGVILQYFSRRYGFEVRKNYSMYCTRRLLQLVQQGNFGVLDAKAIPSLVKIAKGNTLYCGRVANLLVLAAPEVVVTIVSLVFLFLLEPLLTLVLLLVSLVSCVFVYKANIRASVASTLSDRYSPRARDAIRKGLQSRIEGTCDEEYFNDKDWERWLHNFIGKIRAVEEGGLVVGLATAVLLPLLLCGLVLDIMNDMSDWGRVAVYLILFKVASMQLRKLVRIMVSVNRFYPQTRNYWEAVVNRNLIAVGGSKDEDDDE